jgi:hypothetical protein
MLWPSNPVSIIELPGGALSNADLKLNSGGAAKIAQCLASAGTGGAGGSAAIAAPGPVSTDFWILLGIRV